MNNKTKMALIYLLIAMILSFILGILIGDLTIDKTIVSKDKSAYKILLEGQERINK